MKLSYFEGVEAAVRSYQHDKWRLEMVRQTMAKPLEVPCDVILDKINLMSGISDEPVDLDGYEAAAKAILLIVENYLIKAVGKGRDECESLGVEFDS